MNKDQKKSDRAVSQAIVEQYTAPDIVIIDIELEQNIFAGSGELPGMGGEDW